MCSLLDVQFLLDDYVIIISEANMLLVGGQIYWSANMTFFKLWMCINLAFDNGFLLGSTETSYVSLWYIPIIRFEYFK